MKNFTTNDVREVLLQKLKNISPRAILQALFMAGGLFFENNLISFAASCTFGFLFSFIPIVMMIAVFLLHFLHASTDSLIALFGADSIFFNVISAKSILSVIDSFRSFGRFEVVMSLFMMWMARNFFNSVSTGIHHIYKEKVKSRPIINQIIVFGEEIFIVIVSSLLLFLSSTTKTVFNLPILFEIQSFISLHLPQFRYIIEIVEIIKRPLTRFVIVVLPYLYIGGFCTVMYKGAGRERKIPLYLAVCTAFLCTFSFFIVQKCMAIFININKYNVVYGVFSRLIVMLLGIYVFFMLFLFCAELMFVMQYFKELFLGELYVLQDRDRTRLLSKLRYKIFVFPDYLLQKEVNVLYLADKEVLYRAGDKAEYAYYIARGSVKIVHEDGESVLKQGSFFGEVSLTLGKTRDNFATANGDATLIAFDKKNFTKLLYRNSFVSQKVLEQISVYCSEQYLNEKRE